LQELSEKSAQHIRRKFAICHNTCLHLRAALQQIGNVRLLCCKMKNDSGQKKCEPFFSMPFFPLRRQNFRTEAGYPNFGCSFFLTRTQRRDTEYTTAFVFVISDLYPVSSFVIIYQGTTTRNIT